MSDTLNLPPIPPEGSPDFCQVIGLYMSVLSDLPPAQGRRIMAHIQSCPVCMREYQQIRRASTLVASLAVSEPSSHVDQAVMNAIYAQRTSGKKIVPINRKVSTASLSRRPDFRSARPRPVLIGVAAAAAVLLIALATLIPSLTSVMSHQQQAFSLPKNLPWSQDVVYYTLTETDAQGQQYQVKAYHDMTDGMTNSETTMGNNVDVVVVEDQNTQQTLGLDMNHHVAQRDVSSWQVHAPAFDNLSQLRTDLANGKATYLGKGTFNNQPVYRIRWGNSILLLGMDYMPVNALQASSQQPMYQTVQWLASKQVPDSTWDMSVPSGFHLGQLPTKS
jgi:hypothetical protein